MDALIGEVLGQARGIAEDVQRRLGVRMRSATVTAVGPVLIRYDGEDQASVVTPRTVADVLVGDRVVVAKSRGQATILGVLGGGIGGVRPWWNLALINGWQAYPGGVYYPGVRARQTPAGVQIQGMIRNGNAGAIAVLPAGLQPAWTSTFPAAVPGGGSARCAVAMSDGAMTLWYGDGPTAPAFVGINVTLPLD